MSPSPAFGRGGDAAYEADEALSASRSSSNFRRTEYLPNIGKGNSIYIRYLTDSPEWYHMLAHPGAPTKPKSANWPEDRKYPESMPAVCRYDSAWKGIHSDCYICDAKLVNEWGKECKPVVRVWALAVIREEVIGTPEMVAQGIIPESLVGKRVGFKDATREVEETNDKGESTGNKIVEPRIVVVNKPVSNYFGGLQSMYGVFGTICDRDYLLKQNGEKKNVEFQHIPMEPTEGHKPGTESWKVYEKAIKDQGLDIEAMLTDRASDDFYATFFDPSKEPPKREKKGEDAKPSGQASAPSVQQEAAPSNDIDQDKLAAMRARIRGEAPTATAAEPAMAQAGPINFG